MLQSKCQVEQSTWGVVWVARWGKSHRFVQHVTWR